MATDIAGLFATPEQYQLAQDQAQQAQALQYAQLDPRAQAQYGFYRGGQQLGNAIGGALGGQDPQLKLISQRQALSKNVDPNDPQSLITAAQQAAQGGDMQFATVLADRAKTLQESRTKQLQESATAAEKFANVGKIGSEQLTRQQTISALKSQFSMNDSDATAIANNPALVQAYLTPTTSKAFEAIKTGKYTPESAARYANSGNLADLDAIDMSAKPSEDWMKYARQLGLPAKPSYGNYSPEEVALVNDLQFKKDVALNQAKSMSVRVGVDVKAQEAGATESAKLDAKRLDEARSSAAKAQDQKQILATMQQALPNIVSGTGAQARTGFLNLLQTAGLATPEDQNKLASSELFNSLAGERVLSFIKTLGTNPTDTDREFARTIGPALEKGTKSNKDLIDYLSKRADSIINNASSMESHYYENKYSLRGFKPSSDVIPVATPSQGGWSIKKKP
jgi:hypothetical protein